MTYHNHPGEDWPKKWFVKHKMSLPNGETVTVELPEMGSLVGSGIDAMWMREVRKNENSLNRFVGFRPLKSNCY